MVYQQHQQLKMEDNTKLQPRVEVQLLISTLIQTDGDKLLLDNSLSIL